MFYFKIIAIDMANRIVLNEEDVSGTKLTKDANDCSAFNV